MPQATFTEEQYQAATQLFLAKEAYIRAQGELESVLPTYYDEAVEDALEKTYDNPDSRERFTDFLALCTQVPEWMDEK